MITVVDKRNTLITLIRYLLVMDKEIDVEKHKHWLHKHIIDRECDIDIVVCENIIKDIQTVKEQMDEDDNEECEDEYEKNIIMSEDRLTDIFAAKCLNGKDRRDQASVLLGKITSTPWKDANSSPFSKYHIMDMLNVSGKQKFPFQEFDWELCDYVYKNAVEAYKHRMTSHYAWYDYENDMCKEARRIVKENAPHLM